MQLVYFLLGLIVGSFLNVLIYRIPRGEQFVAGHSRCTHCDHILAWYDLIPVASFLVLGGKCRYCKQAISPQYPIIEIISGLFFALAPSIPMLIVLELMLVLAMIDAQHFLIPDIILIGLVLVSLFTGAISWNHVLSALGCGGFFFALWAISKGRWIGFGDVKLAAVLGLLFGFPGAVVVIYVAVIIGGLFGVILLLLHKATGKTPLPFGTLLGLCAGLFIFLQQPILKALAWLSF